MTFARVYTKTVRTYVIWRYGETAFQAEEIAGAKIQRKN
jgi:hypothetical protein